MASTSSRTLQLLSLLQTHRHWSGGDLAGRLEISVRTLRRDVDRLRELGYPVDASRGVDGGYSLAPGATLPPLLIDDEEAVALAVGMQAAAQGAIAGIEESALRALTKVVGVLPPRLRRRVAALQAVTVPATSPAAGGPTVDPAVLIAVAQTCRDSERLEFAYTARGGEQTERHVEPLKLVCMGRRWYLVAYDTGRHDWRSFRIDRLTRPRGTNDRFRPRDLPATDAAEFVRRGTDQAPRPFTVEVLVEAPAAVVRQRIGRWYAVSEAGPQRCVLQATADALEWPAMALGIVGADFEVRSPPELVELLGDWAARFSRATAG